MGAVLGLAFGVGLLLVITGVVRRPEQRRSARPRTDPVATVRTSAGSLIAGLLGAVGCLVLTAIPMAALLAGVAAASVPFLLRRRSRHQQQRAQAAAWPDAVDGLLSATRAGVPLSEAICEAAVVGPEPLRAGFARYAAVWRRGGSFEEALAALQRFCQDPSADRVAVSLALAAQTGGSNVGRVLATQADFLRSDLRMRGEIDARQSWTVSAARVAVAAPWLAMAALSLRSEAAKAYATPLGAAVLLVTALVGVASYAAMRRIAALPAPQRLPEVGT
jgi:tight adherence protein B